MQERGVAYLFRYEQGARGVLSRGDFLPSTHPLSQLTFLCNILIGFLNFPKAFRCKIHEFFWKAL
jgi:hypothetical protein